MPVANTRSNSNLERILFSRRKSGSPSFVTSGVIFFRPSTARAPCGGARRAPRAQRACAYANGSREFASAAAYEADRCASCQLDAAVYAGPRRGVNWRLALQSAGIHALVSTGVAAYTPRRLRGSSRERFDPSLPCHTAFGRGSLAIHSCG